MEKKYLLVTNNIKVWNVYKNHPVIDVEFLQEQGYWDVLICVRDHIHEGWHLLTHPQASNLKPMQTPFKSILIASGDSVQTMAEDIEMIEFAIAGYQKLTAGKKLPKWTEKILDDFCTIDLSVIESAINSSSMKNRMYARG